MGSCLEPEDLARLAAGELPAAAERSAREHLETCIRCREAFEAQRADDLWFSQLQVALGGELPAETVEPEPPAPIAAEAIAGYTIQHELHRGGQGVVYRAVQRATKRTVALKILLQGVLASPRQKRRFEREVDLVAGLRHPYIVTIYESGECQGRPYFAMEYIDGVPLNQFFPPHPRSVADVLELFVKICEAVRYAHRRGVIHRDLKPGNILIDAMGEPHLVDFGLAKLTDDPSAAGELRTHTGEFLGTLAYASPEQARGVTVEMDTRSDVYSLGVILYELLTGAFPYSVRGPIAQVLLRITDSTPDRPRLLRDDLDDDLETILLTALAKEPDRRYASADSLLQDLEHYRRGEPLAAKRDSAWYVLRKAVRRHRTAVAMTVVVVAVLQLGLASSLWFWRLAVAERDDARRSRAQAAHLRDVEQQQRVQAEWQAYLANVAAAGAALQARDVVEARVRLDQAPASHRDWEWRFLHDRLDESRQVLRGHGEYLYAAAWSPDGQTILSAGWDGRVRWWEASSGKLIREYASSAPLQPARWSPDGTHVAVGSPDGGLLLWEAAHLEAEPRQIPFPEGRLVDLAFRPDGQVLAVAIASRSITGQNQRVVLLDVMTGKFQREILRGQRLNSLAFLPDGAGLILGGPQGTSRLDLQDEAGQRVWSAGSQREAHVAVDPTGRLVASADGNRIRIRESASGKDLQELVGHTAPVFAIGWGPDGQRLVSASRDRTVRWWDVETGTLEAVRCGHTWTISAASFHPRTQSVLTSSWDGTVRIWDDPRQRPPAVLLGHTRSVSSLSFSADGEHLVSGSWDGTARWWSLANGASRLLGGHAEPIQCVALDHNERRVATASWDQTIQIWTLDGSQPPRTLRGHTDRVQGLAFAADGELLSGSRDNSLRAWSAESGELRGTFLGHDDHVHSVAVSHDGRWVASSGHQSLRVWDRASRQEVARLPRRIVQEDYSLAFSPRGDAIAAGSDVRTLSLWTWRAPGKVVSFQGHSDEVSATAFQPSGRRLASCSEDGTVRLWDVATATEVGRLGGFTGKANCLAFSPNGTILAAGMADGSIHLWRASLKVN